MTIFGLWIAKYRDLRPPPKINRWGIPARVKDGAPERMKEWHYKWLKFCDVLSLRVWGLRPPRIPYP